MGLSVKIIPVKTCGECNKQVVGRYLSLGLCPTCYARKRYRNNLEVRQRVIKNTINWQKKNPNAIQEWKENNIDKLHASYKRYNRRHPDRISNKNHRMQSERRHEALLKVGHGVIKCVCCGCDREEILHINHKNGGGTKERKETRGSGDTMARRIVNGTRSVDDLELRCYPCNALHYIELKYGKIPMKIMWGGDDG